MAEGFTTLLLAAFSMKTKAEKREEKRRKRRLHKVSGANVKKLAKLIEAKSAGLTR